MTPSNKDNSSQIEDQKPEEGPFTPKQMRALKLLTGTMGVMIIICVILLGVGLSRQASKLSAEGPPPEITLAPQAEIRAISANGRDGLWLYIVTDGVEEIRYVKASGAEAGGFAIIRD